MMSENSVTNQTSDQNAADPAGAFGTIVRLAGESPTRRRYYCDTLACIARALASPFAMIEADLSSEVVSEYYHAGPTDPEFWKPTVVDLLNMTLSERVGMMKLYGARNSDDASGRTRQMAIMTALLTTREGRSFGAIALVSECRGQADAEARHAVMKTLAALAGDCAALTEANQAAENSKNDKSAGDVGVISKASAYGSVEEMAIAITNNLRNRTGCDQVALGRVQGKGIRLLSISGFDEVRSRTPGAEVVLAAMTECLDAGHAAAFPNLKNETDEGTFLLHQRWSGAVHGSAVASAPLMSDGRIVAILSFRRESEEPFSTAKLTELAKTLSPYATAMELVERATETAADHVKRSARRTLNAAMAPGKPLRRAALVAVVAACCWMAFGRLDYTVTAPAAVKPAQFRCFSAPFDGELTVAPLATGDRVRAGQMLCEFDATPYRQRRRQLSAQLDMARIEANKARSEQKPAAAAIAEAEAERITALIAETDAMIERAAVRAPFDGTVISGDFRRRVGQVLPRGEMLYSIASDQGWRVSVDVPQMYAAELQKDLTGRFVANARPGAVLNLRLLRVTPAASAPNGRNVFTCEASLDADQQWIRSGMEGVAKVSLGRRPVWWILSHRIVNFVRMKLWL